MTGAGSSSGGGRGKVGSSSSAAGKDRSDEKEAATVAAKTKTTKTQLAAENQALKDRLAAFEAASGVAPNVVASAQENGKAKQEAKKVGKTISTKRVQVGPKEVKIVKASEEDIEVSFPAVGSKVRLQGLSATELNGEIGLVIADRGVLARGRVPVQLSDDRQVNVKAENLVAINKQMPSKKRAPVSQDSTSCPASSSSKSANITDADRPRKTARKEQGQEISQAAGMKLPKGQGAAKAKAKHEPMVAAAAVPKDKSKSSSASEMLAAPKRASARLAAVKQDAVKKQEAGSTVLDAVPAKRQAMDKGGNASNAENVKRVKSVPSALAGAPVANDTAAVPEPPRRRLMKKSAGDQTPNIAMMIRKLGEEKNGENPEANGTGTSKHSAGPIDLAAAASAEAEIIAAMKDDDGNGELEGEEKTQRKRATGKGKGKDEDDDDNLFDADDLEGEEQVSDLSDIGEVDEDEDEDYAWDPVNAWKYPKVWPATGLRPGQAGFNDVAAEAAASARLGMEDSPLAGLGLRLHQESVGFLVHPESPIERILVDHATGTGKTLIMLRVLENFFDDPRPKVAIFPKDKICDNFYQEMLKWPTRWRDYFCAARPEEASLASGVSNWKRKRADMWDLNNERLRNEAKRRNVRLETVVRQLIDSIKEVLQMKNSIRSGKLKAGFAKKFRKANPGVPVPRAPLRCFRYTTAGGGACELGNDGWPRSPILKVGFDKKELNPYSRKVVIMDECHNLTRPSIQFEEQLGRLREHLNGCRETVLAGFTGTPVGDQHEFGITVDHENDADLGLELDCDPGDAALFIKDVRRGSLVEQWNIDNERSQVKSGDVVVAVNFLRGVKAERLMAELQRVGTLRLTLQRQEGRLLLDVMKGRAAGQCSDEGFVSSFHARNSNDFCREHPVKGIPDGIIHEGMFDDLVTRHSLHGEALKRYILKEVEFQTVPRLMRLPEEKRMGRLANYCNLHVHYGSLYGANRDNMLKDVKDHAPKMHAIAKSVAKTKEKAVIMMSREMGFKAMLEVMQKTGKKAGFRVATMDDLSDFNDAKRNLRGERFRVLLGESSQAGEGVQFKNVRRIYLVDVPLRHSDLVQRTSRCVRMCGHAALPEDERSLAIELHTAQLPKFMRHGPGSLIYRELLNAKDVHATPGPLLENACMACLEELKNRNIKTLVEFQKELQAEGGDRFIELLTETVLEHLCGETKALARPLSMALWRLRRGGDDLELLERALQKGVRTADEILLDWLVDKSAELLPPLEAMRLNAVDRKLLAPLGDPPAAPPPRSEVAKKKRDKAIRQMKKDVKVDAPVDVKDAGLELDDEGNVEDLEDLEEALADVEALNDVLEAEGGEDVDIGDEALDMEGVEEGESIDEDEDVDDDGNGDDV